MKGKSATLITPYKEYYNIILLFKEGLKWTVEVCGSGKILEYYEDEFVLDN